jgi:hypothetical protein
LVSLHIWSWVSAESWAPKRDSFRVQSPHAATWHVSPHNDKRLPSRLIAVPKLVPVANPAHFHLAPHCASQFLLQGAGRWLGFSQCATRVMPCQCQRRHGLLAGAPPPCNDVGIHARAGSAGAGRSGRPQRDALTLPSGAGGAEIGYGTCEAEGSAGGATPGPGIRAQSHNCSPAPVSQPFPGGTAAC